MKSILRRGGRPERGRVRKEWGSSDLRMNWSGSRDWDGISRRLGMGRTGSGSRDLFCIAVRGLRGGGGIGWFGVAGFFIRRRVGAGLPARLSVRRGGRGLV